MSSGLSGAETSVGRNFPLAGFTELSEKFIQSSRESRIKNLNEFISLIENYDNTKSGFNLIVSVALDYVHISQSELARQCETTPVTVARWARGAAPSSLARTAVIERIRIMVERQLCIPTEDRTEMCAA